MFKKINELIKSIVDIFSGRNGRKVAFGVWLFWASTSLLMADKITAPIWWNAALTSALLIGFGTLLDRFLEKVGDTVAMLIGERVAGMVNEFKRRRKDDDPGEETPRS